MEYITNNTFRKIFSTFKLTEIGNKKYDDQLIDLNLNLIEKIKCFFKDSESIEIGRFHKSNNKYKLNSFEETVEYATHHSKEDCKILLSDFQNVEIPGELITNVIERNKNIGKNDEEIKKVLIDEVSKFRKVVKKHFPHLEDFKSSNTAFENEINEIWGIESEVEIIFANNSGSIRIENPDLIELDAKIKLITNKIITYTDNKISSDDILLIMFNLFVNKVKLEYSNKTFDEYEDKILSYLNLIKGELTFDIKNIFDLYFKIIFNNSITFESNLFLQLNLKFCHGDCGVEMIKKRRENLLNEKKQRLSANS